MFLLPRNVCYCLSVYIYLWLSLYSNLPQEHWWHMDWHNHHVKLGTYLHFAHWPHFLLVAKIWNILLWDFYLCTNTHTHIQEIKWKPFIVSVFQLDKKWSYYCVFCKLHYQTWMALNWSLKTGLISFNWLIKSTFRKSLLELSFF